MKKNILIGGGVLVLFALIWIGARNLNAAAKKDVSSDHVESTAAESADTKKLKINKSNADDLNVEDTDAVTEGTSDDGETVGNTAEEPEDITEEAGDTTETKTDANVAAADSSEGNTLYTIKTSAGNNLGMVPVVNGNAVVLMDGSYASIYQGEYTPQEQDAFSLKMENETAKALSNSKIAEWAFYRETMLYDFTFPESVREIEKFAFARSSLSGVVIPEGVTRIGYGAFYHCDALTDVTIPNSVTVIEENAFSHTPWLDNWLAGGEETADEQKEANDFLIVGDGILLAYRGSEADPELPAEVKSVVPGVLGE